MPRPTAQILEGCRPLEDVPGVELLTDATWDEDGKHWYLELEIETALQGSADIPKKTRWYVRLSPTYPQGSIDIFPASEGGISQTFRHQLNNGTIGEKTAPKRRWRLGKICVDTGTAALDRHGVDLAEPRTAASRLRWHVERTKLWIHAAATDMLSMPGDPFELPDYRPIAGTAILFHENESSLATWAAAECNWGWVNFAPVNSKTLATTVFSAPSGEPVHTPNWGTLITSRATPEVGLWMRVTEPLVLKPWQAPMTWGAIEDCFKNLANTPLTVLERNAHRLQDGRNHFMLIGFPIPSVIGGPPVRIHWVAIRLPLLTQPGARIKGFRNSEQGHWSYDQTRLFRPGSPVQWAPTENGDDSELTSRGSLHPNWRAARVLVIGNGALGSVVSELLIRGGVRQLVLCDSEVLEAGNLVRHTLTTESLGDNKAEALSARLNLASPNACVRSIAGAFPPTKRDDVELAAQAMVVIDCSANDNVLHHLSTFPFASPPAVFHVSFGSRAGRLFLYGRSPGPVAPEAYLDWIDPWIALERAEFSGSAEIRPSAGCWHPAFPARADHVWLLAASSVNWMSDKLQPGEFDHSEVFKRTEAFELVSASLTDG